MYSFVCSFPYHRGFPMIRRTLYKWLHWSCSLYSGILFKCKDHLFYALLRKPFALNLPCCFALSCSFVGDFSFKPAILPPDRPLPSSLFLKLNTSNLLQFKKDWLAMFERVCLFRLGPCKSADCCYSYEAIMQRPQNLSALMDCSVMHQSVANSRVCLHGFLKALRHQPRGKTGFNCILGPKVE
mgnify:CR=1 FL=1